MSKIIDALVKNLEDLLPDYEADIDIDALYDRIMDLYEKTPKSDDHDMTVVNEINREFNRIYDLILAQEDAKEKKKAKDTFDQQMIPFIEWINNDQCYNSTFDFSLALPNMKERVEGYNIEIMVESAGLNLENESLYKCKICGAKAGPREKQTRGGDEGVSIEIVCSVQPMLHVHFLK